MTLPAFPGAMGFGALARGGRGPDGTPASGRRVIFVDTVEDGDHPGTFRYAVMQPGPRFVLFRTAGDLVLTRDLEIRQPYLTIAGQSAPYGGICVRNAATHNRPTMRVLTGDVVIRHLRARHGQTAAHSPSNVCLFIGEGSHDVIVDHSSFSWADEGLVVTGYNAHDVTIQWCIIAEALNSASHARALNHTYEKPEHRRISDLFNLMAHVQFRVPQIATFDVEVIGNVIHHTLDQAMNVNANPNSGGKVYLNDMTARFIDNHLSRIPKGRAVKLSPEHGAGTKLHVRGNIDPYFRLGDSADQRETLDPSQWHHFSPTPDVFAMPPIPVVSAGAADARARVLAGAGATMPIRDAVDSRLVAQVSSGTGNVIRHENEVGGYPDLRLLGAPPLPDRNLDGIPNAWARQHGRPAALDLAPTGYTWLETYLNDIAS